MVDREHNRILVWLNGSSTSPKTVSGTLINPSSLFVTKGGDIYVYDSPLNDRIVKLRLDSNTSEFVTNISEPCTRFFVDLQNSIYCSSTDQHRIIRMNGTADGKTSSVVAGVGCPGPLFNMLHYPQGIFVDVKFNLYVADSFNNRIQRFAYGEANGITLMGFEASVRSLLHRPTSVVLDDNGDLFVVDSNNHRIVRSTCFGFECLVGCSSEIGSAANHLDHPQSMAFDSAGNMWVTDMGNNRIQRFILNRSTCGMSLHF